MAKVFFGFICLFATGFIFDICFKGMNYASDATYVGGGLGVVVWSMLMWVVWRKILKGDKKHEESSNNSCNTDGGIDLGGLHPEDRAGNGGDRSGSEREPTGSTGHNA